MDVSKKELREHSDEIFDPFLLIFSSTVLFLLIHIIYFFPFIKEKYMIIFYIFAVPLLSNFLFYFFLDRTLNKNSNVLLKLSQVFAILSLITVIFYGLHNISSVVYRFSIDALPPQIPISNERFMEGEIVAFLFLGIAILLCFISTQHNWSRFSISRILRYGLYGVGGLILLTLFDLNIVSAMRTVFASTAYAPYTGPASSVLLGGIPLIDVFGQYGLGYLLFSLIWLVVPPSLLTAGIFVCFLNIFYYLMLLAVIVKLARNKLLIFLISVGVIVFINSYLAYNIEITPSVLAFRFLPPLLLVFTLSRLPSDKLFQWDTLGALFLASLWSIEAMVGSFIIYSTYIILVEINSHTSILNYVRYISILLILIILPHIILTLSDLVIFNQWPRYDIYLDIIAAYATREQFWFVPLDPSFTPIFLFAFGYGLGLSYTLHSAIKDKVNASKAPQIGTLAILGVLEFMYFLGRPELPLLFCVFFPLALLAILSLDWAVTQLSEYPKTRHYMTWPTLVIAFVLFPLMGATFIDKYPIYPSAHTLLWSCINKAFDVSSPSICNPIEAFKMIKDQIRNDSSNFYRYKETLNLVRKYTTNKKDILILHYESPAILLFLRKKNSLGFSSSVNESLSNIFVKEFTEKLNNSVFFHRGDIAIIQDPAGLNIPIERIVLNELRNRWKLCFLESVVDTGVEVSAYLLELKEKACPHLSPYP